MATELQKLRRLVVRMVLAQEKIDRGTANLVDLERVLFELYQELRTKKGDPPWLIRAIRKAGICPCKTIVEDPGPHLKSCPWSDSNYGEGF